MKRWMGAMAAALTASAAAGSVQAASLVVAGDEWVLSNDAFAHTTVGADAGRLARNLAAMWSGPRVVMASDNTAYMPHSNLTSLRASLEAAGKTVVDATTVDFSTLGASDALMLFGMKLGASSPAALEAHVRGGGNVFVSLGTGW